MLTAKVLRFVDEYAVDGNATRAAEAAGFSAKTAYSQGARLSKRPDVAAAIAAKKAESAERNKLTADWVIERLKTLADAGIKGDSVRAIELLGKTLGMFITEKHEHSGPDGEPLTVQTIRRVIVDPKA